MLRSWFLHDRLLVRFAALLVAGAFLILLAWTVSYYALPEGLLRGRTAGGVLAGEQAAASFGAEWLRLLVVNIVLGVLFVGGPSLMRVSGYPYSYFTPLIWAALYGVTLGTNSFSLSLPERLAPTLAVLGRSGPYEIAAYLLLGASLHRLALWDIVGTWPRQTLQRTQQGGFKALSRTAWWGIGAAALLLAAACAWEAYQITHYAG